MKGKMKFAISSFVILVIAVVVIGCSSQNGKHLNNNDPLNFSKEEMQTENDQSHTEPVENTSEEILFDTFNEGTLGDRLRD